MVKYFKKSFLTALILVFTASVCMFSVSAAARATLVFSSSKPTVGQSVSVKVTIDGGEPMYNATFDLSYNPDVLKFISADDTVNGSGAGVVKASPNPGGKTKATYTFNFTALAAGACNISVSGGAYGRDNDLSFGASATMTVTDAAKSDNANLKSLSLSKGTLSPKFSASKTSYTASVANDVTECKVYATAADSAAKVEVSGSSALKVGKNTRTVTVTAASGAQKTYTITITRLEEDDTASSEPDDTSSEPEVNPYETTVDGAVYTVATDISGITLPNGFEASKAEYNGAEVAVAKDKGDNYTVYYLKGEESDTHVPYLLSEDGTTFEKLKYAVFGANTYIFADFPENTKAPEGYYQTNTEIGGFNVKAYMSDNPEYTDFYYLYCFFDGGFKAYRYDSRENVLQRAPEFKLVSAEDNSLPVDAGFAARFKSLSTNAKVIVIGLLLAAIGAIALIILLIVKLVKGADKFEDDFDEEELFAGDFDEITVSDGAENLPEQKTDAQNRND